ncbi:4-alpha-glucanotransferase [Streptomyces albus]
MVTESGDVLGRQSGAELPPGVHTLCAQAPGERPVRSTLVVAPGAVPAPRTRTGRSRGPGLLVHLPGLLSSRSWGMGDLADLGDLASWAGRCLDADFLQPGPLHTAVPAPPGGHTALSPYRPLPPLPRPRPSAHRGHPRIRLSGARGAAPRRRARRPGRRAAREGVLNGDAHLDPDAVRDLKLRALELVRTVQLSPGRRAAYCDFLAARGQALEDHATWCAFAERYGPDWRSWPAGLDDPRSARTARERDDQLERIDFHCWAAWLTDCQLAAAQRAARDAGMAVGLVHEAAAGVHPGGADAWAQQDVLAPGVSLGAPPTAGAPGGLDHGVPPWHPDALARTGYGPWREVLAGLFRHAGAVRIDHLGSRQWWIPEGRPPSEGAWVRYGAEALWSVLALEAHRAGAAVTAGDPGAEEPGFREDLAARRVLGTRVLWCERDGGPSEGAGPVARPVPPERWPADCLATAAGPELPGCAARLTGSHVRLLDGLGLLRRPGAQERAAEAAGLAEWFRLFARLGLLPEGRGDEEGEIRAVHRFLARTPARLVGVWLPDAVGDRRPVRVPGTTTEYPNWRLPLAGPDGRPLSLEEVTASSRVRRLVEALREELRATAQ